MVFLEEESRARIKNLAVNLAARKNITFNMLKKADIKPRARARRKMAGWDDNFMLNVLKTLATNVI